MPKKYVHPIIRQIDKDKQSKKISNEKIAEYLLINKRTFYRRRKNPDSFTAFELERLAELFGWPPLIKRRLTA